MRIDLDKVKKSKDNYYKTMVSMTKEDRIFVTKNKLSVTKILREAIDYLRNEELKSKLQSQQTKTNDMPKLSDINGVTFNGNDFADNILNEVPNECPYCDSDLISLDEKGFTCNNCGIRYKLKSEATKDE